MKKTTRMPAYRSIFLVLLLCVLLLGTGFVLEASSAESFATYGSQYTLFQRHLIGLGLGLFSFAVGAFVPAKTWVKLGPILYGAGLLGLLLVFIPGLGQEFNGAHRWVSLGGFVIQPVEMFKFAMIAFLASWLPRHQRLLPLLATLALPSLLIILQPDLGSLLLVLTTGILVFFLAGGSVKQLSLIAAVGIPLIIFAILSSPYRKARVETFFNPESDPLGSSFHIRQITLALGRGGWTGQGIGNSSQKFAYIPEASTDSIFAIVAEELGFLGSLVTIILFVGLLYTGWRAVVAAEPEPAVRLLALGCLVWITVQVVLNLSAVVGLVPLTGVPLPFFSYGRSSLIMLLFAAGVLVQSSKKAS